MNITTVNREVLTPVNFLQRSAEIYKDKVAVVYQDKRYTYTEFQDRVHCLAKALKNAGIGKGDKVAFMCPNTPPMLEAHYAVPMIGAALVSINIRLSSEEVLYIVNHSDAKALFVDTEFADAISSIQSRLENVEFMVDICDVDSKKRLSEMEYERFLMTGINGEIETDINSEYEVATINYTSGTTGLPKGVMYHHRGAYLNAMGEIIEFGLTSRSVYLWTLPMFHCNGWCFTWAVTAVGGTHVCLRRVVAEDILKYIQIEQVSHLCAAPTVLIGLSEYAVKHQLKLDRKVEIMTAGAPPSPTVIKNVETLGANVTQTYGLTEVFGPYSICAWQDKWNQLPDDTRAGLKARQGVAYIVARNLDVVDPSTMQPVPKDGKTVGEIVMQGNTVMLGYYKDPDATQKAFYGGFFHSGDLAVMHEDGYIQIVDRKKDIIISGGENISTVEVENIIYQHPDVLEVAVVPIPDPKWGEVVKAFVKIKDGCQPSEQDIIDFCKSKLARFKAPRKVEFCELPKTATGKIKKYQLREKEWKGFTKKVA